MFMGEYNHSVDAKGRLIVPSKFREQLGNEFVVTKGLDGCLFVYSQEEWKRIEESLREKPLTSKDARKFMRFFFAFSRVEIWSKERYLENNNFDDMDEIAEHMAELGIGI